jgi:hypothetical protein
MMPGMPPAPDIRTARLSLRRPGPADRRHWVALHRDPRTYAHAPQTTREAVLDLWQATTEAGGAVGFVPGASRGAHEAALAAHDDIWMWRRLAP